MHTPLYRSQKNSIQSVLPTECFTIYRPSREVLGSNANVARALLQRLQQLQRCDAGEGGGVEIKRHVTKALAAVRSAAILDPRAAADDVEFPSRQDKKSAPDVACTVRHAVDTAVAAPAPASSSLMSLKAQRVTSGALPPPPSLALPWTTSALPAPAHEGGNFAEVAEAPAPAYSAQRYSPRAADVEQRDHAWDYARPVAPAAAHDESQTQWPGSSLLRHQSTKQQQDCSFGQDAQQQGVPLPPPQNTPPAAAARPASPSPSSSRSSPSRPSLLDSIALASAGESQRPIFASSSS
jgi:hypothetical protein